MKFKLPLIFLFFITIATGIVIIGLGRSKKSNVNVTIPEVTLPNIPNVLAAPDTTLESPDGKDSLTIQEKIDKESIKYTITTSLGLIFTKTVSKSDNLSLPFNSWSPDNKYVFIKEVSNGISNFYVLSSSNKPFPNNVKYLNVTESFANKIPDFKLQDITGWAAPTLLIVNSDKNNESQGPSFWFDITSQNFIQLSTRFN
ncbi:hypothetical protein A3A50_03820 [Candidatus Woesebacteria bacterium RIFCSPLOWO2_01_FULL_38_20]|nr:MAG: hypothetical protein A3A50_03820 [Candidatus Woesebacteria bacterium RIFCSPLOWO2_01_FULL_38_20]